MKTIEISRLAAPEGMSGLAVEPWSKGEVYAVAANWAQASDPVMTYGEDGWDIEEHGRQVADFRHNPKAALRAQIKSAIEHSGDEFDDDEIDGIVEDAVELLSAEVAEMADMLERHGDRFTGNNVLDEAQGWIDQEFGVDEADGWCEIGCWEAETASAFRAAKLTPDQVRAAAERLVEDEIYAWDRIDELNPELRPISRDSQYTDGCPIYSCCNGDTDVSEIIEAAE